MSTDDLTARARKRAAHWPMTETSALLIELADTIDVLLGDDNADVQTANVVAQIRAENKRLADEVDRLRALHADLTARLGYGDGITEPQADNDTIVRGVDQDRMDAHDAWEERDAARAENERLRAAAVEARNELRWRWGQAADAAETFEAERDAARAALERVRAVTAGSGSVWTGHILNALEGKAP